MIVPAMKLIAESDYRAKVLFLSFESLCVLKSPSDVRKLQTEWFEILKTWHSPYKAVIDGRNLKIESQDEFSIKTEFERLKKLLERFFLRKAVAYGVEEKTSSKVFPFENFSTEEEALEALNLRDFSKKNRELSDLRSLIAFDNHFKDETIELSFLAPVYFKEKKDLAILKSKLMNNLMLWHSGWNLLVDCSKFSIEESLFGDFSLFEKSLKGFFLKQVIGYNPSESGLVYPFPVYRSRHKAVLNFEDQSKGKGDVSNCATRKSR